MMYRIVYTKLSFSLCLVLFSSWLQVVMAEPRNKDALLSLAQVYYNLEDYRRAEDTLQTILNLAPLHKDALYMLGYLYYKKELYSEAIATLQRLTQIDSTHSDAKTLLNMGSETHHYRKDKNIWYPYVFVLLPMCVLIHQPHIQLIHFCHLPSLNYNFCGCILCDSEGKMFFHMYVCSNKYVMYFLVVYMYMYVYINHIKDCK